MEEAWLAIIGLAGVVLGWGLEQLSRLIYDKKERRERSLPVYQQAFAHLRQLEDSVPNAANFTTIQPNIDDFKQWWYQNSLFLDPQTNDALVGVVNIITTQMLPTPTAKNILTIKTVSAAFHEAENAIRSATGQKLLKRSK